VTQPHRKPLSDRGLEGMSEEAGLMIRFQQEHLDPSARGSKKVRKLINKCTTATAVV
jgi:hypothetical protein